ncbi:MAG: hypothetical protein QOI25_2262 [Mycobacterium sp.]|nr:hypothetical protein [Mycobacterium sp.]
MIGVVGQLPPVTLDDLAGQRPVHGRIGARCSSGTSAATYLVLPTVTFGSARTLRTHSVSPRVETRYITPSTSGTTTGIS